MESLGKIIYDGFDKAKMRRTVMEAATALFEGLTPQQKARRTIRQLLPAPPNGWDAIAVDEQGNPLLTADNHNQMSIINCLEYHIRSIFFHDGRSNPKFEPGVARIAYTEIGVWPEDLPDWRPNHPEHRTNGIRPIINVLREISGVHSDDYDFDLNGMSGDELIARFAHGSTGQKYINEEADGSGTDYKVVWIPNFETAKKYGHYTKNTQQWCLTDMRRYWNNYTKGNTVKMYFLIAPNVDEVEPEPGPNAPLDEYGLSLIGVGIAPDGTLDNCCTRWNHLQGGTDMSLSEEQLCKLLNVRELSDICPPFTEEDQSAITVNLEKIISFAKENADNSKAVNTYWEVGDYRMLGVTINESLNVVLVRKDWTLAFPYPITQWKPSTVSPSAYSVVLWYDPYSVLEQPVANADDNAGDDAIEGGYEPFAIFRFDGKYKLFPDTEDVSVKDVLRYADSGEKGILSGRYYTLHVDYEDTALFNVTTMEIESDDVDIHYLPGNLFIMDHYLCLMKPDGYVQLSDDVGRDDAWITGNAVSYIGYDDDDRKVFRRIDPISGSILTGVDDIIGDHSMGVANARWLELRSAEGSKFSRYALVNKDTGEVVIPPCDVYPARVGVHPLSPRVMRAPYESHILTDGGVPIYDEDSKKFSICYPNLPKALDGACWVDLFVCGDAVTVMHHNMNTDTGYSLITPDGKVHERHYTCGFNSTKYGILQSTEHKYCNIINANNGELVFPPNVERYISDNLYSVGLIKRPEIERAIDSYVTEKSETMTVDYVNYIFITRETQNDKFIGPSRIFVYSPISNNMWSAIIKDKVDDDYACHQIMNWMAARFVYN